MGWTWLDYADYAVQMEWTSRNMSELCNCSDCSAKKTMRYGRGIRAQVPVPSEGHSDPNGHHQGIYHAVGPYPSLSWDVSEMFNDFQM